MDTQNSTNEKQQPQVNAAGEKMARAAKLRAEGVKFGHIGVKGYIALLVAVLFFSGVFMKLEGLKWLSAMDFTTLSGAFGTMKKPEVNNFLGAGGTGARAGFLFAISLAPGVMLALGFLEVFSHYGAIKAAHRLLTPLLRPFLGIPGLTGLALITDLQSTDAGAALTKGLYDDQLITKKELIIISAWQYSGAGLISNYFTIGSAYFAFLVCPIWLPLVVMFVLKFTGAKFVQIMLNTVYKKDFQNEKVQDAGQGEA
ncbi:MAG: hypothetical protein LKI63_00105 [Megasphaera sp.]|nr:hypothetical protein [Megasphaera sp.]